MVKSSITVRNKDTLGDILKVKRESEARGKLLFIGLVADMEV